MTARPLALAAVLPAVLVAAGCGGGKNATSNPAGTSNTTPATSTAASTSPGALQAEAASAATGDIPDNQVYLVFRSPAWSIKYPEGWAQSGGPNATVFRDKNNIARIVIHPGAAPTAAQVRSDPSLRQAHISSAPKTMTIKGSSAIKVVYTTRSPPNPVTGKRVTLTVDRYYLSRSGKVATIDLGTPVGVDNVDAYRLMSESFRWR
jgi:hypothetical protein